MKEDFYIYKQQVLKNLPRILLSALAWISFFGFLWLFFLGIVERSVANIMLMSFVVGLASSHDSDRERKSGLTATSVVFDEKGNIKK